MMMHHWVFLSLLCFLTVSICLCSFSGLSMRSLKVGSLNINGGRDRQKRALISEISDQKKIDVLFLQETHTVIQDETDWGLWWKGSHRLSHGTNFSAGVAVLFREAVTISILSCTEVVKGRLLVVRASIEDSVYCFVNIYAPNSGRERVRFYTQLKNELIMHQEEYIIIGGDFNCTLDFTADRIGEEPHPQSSQTLSNAMLHLDLLDSFRIKHPRSRQYTWVRVCNNQVCAARLDRIYISETLSPRLISCNINPVGFTDHHLVTVEIAFSSGARAKSCWHFNNKLLLDKVFCQDFERFWNHWRTQKVKFCSLKLWWEVGKAQIRVFCQQYTSYSSARIKTVINDLESDIKSIEEGLNRSVNDMSGPLLEKKRSELSSLLQERVKGALVRSRFLQLKDMDAPSSFFFNLERSVAEKKLMTCLKLPGGSITTDPAVMRKHAMDFYAGLFRSEPCDRECREELLKDLPQLSAEEKADLDKELTLEELTSAVNQLASGRAPGIDGLPIDFFKTFWNIMGRDLHGVFMECYKTGCLPVSCQRAVLSLLPKKGDLALLKNWRPVALLCSDYKVLSRALSNRLKEVLGNVIHMDQNYCVLDRNIMDNIFLIRDVIDVCKCHNVNIGIVSLDQEKAFDRVNHSYLFSTLRAFGFGDGFVSWLGLLYCNAQCLVKIGAGLSRPISVQRGIRQGCPISGQLYSLAIEPLLCRLRDRLSGFSLPGSCGFERSLILSAYADDINIFVSNQEDVQCLQGALSLYEKATSARVNWAKSEALLLGQWRDRAVPFLPGGLKWEREGLKVLGVFLGTEGYKLRNWEGMREEVCARLSRWKWLLPQLSYRGRVLVVNNLVASTLWHKLIPLTPPRGFIEDIQRTILDFFWSGKHWIRAAALCLPVAEGGQGLVDIQSKVAAFRLQTAQRILYNSGPSWLDTARLLLRRAGRLDYDKQLFLVESADLDLSGLTSFYSSVLQAWQGFKFQRAGNQTPGMWVFEEPLFCNGFLKTLALQSASLRTSLRGAGCTKVGHLMKLTAVPVNVRRERSKITSIRLFNRVVAEVCEAFPPHLRPFVRDRTLCEQWNEGSEYSFPALSVSPAVGEWRERGDGCCLSQHHTWTSSRM
uniref:Reverse transcriptase domain-containing protein n=1 Tax=Lates calcarifer TaxID=8187 RepID=A0A4W6F6F5_LATCA